MRLSKERPKMKAEIIVILDRSGSMNTIKDDAIGGFNQFIESQKKIEGEATVTLVQFDDQYEMVYENVPLEKVVPLNRDTFIPRGSTALYDAIGKTIGNINRRNFCSACHADTKRIMVILTDGQENASREYRQHTINEMINHQRSEHKWEFIFLAANQDAFAAGAAIGIHWGDTHQFVADAVGTRNAYVSMDTSVSSYRADIKSTTKAEDYYKK